MNANYVEDSDFVHALDDKVRFFSGSKFKIENDGRDLPRFEPRTDQLLPTAIASSDVFYLVGVITIIVLSLVGMLTIITACYERWCRSVILAKPSTVSTTAKRIDAGKCTDMKTTTPVTLDSFEQIVKDARRLRTLMELLKKALFAKLASVKKTQVVMNVAKTPSFDSQDISSDSKQI